MDPKLIYDRLRRLHGKISAKELAEVYGVPISREAWQSAEGKVIYLAESSLNPPHIFLNSESIELAVEGGCIGGDATQFDRSQIEEVVIAHELYHILACQSSSPATESMAHEFAEIFTGISLSQIEANLRRAAGARHASPQFEAQTDKPF
jgi:hypothetical protein